jgi:hypothetical protein
MILLQIEVTLNYLQSNSYKRIFYYEDCICVGEMLRNICVNVGGIDPDTENGITKNIVVYNLTKDTDSRMPWTYNPYQNLDRIQKNGRIVVAIQFVS